MPYGTGKIAHGGTSEIAAAISNSSGKGKAFAKTKQDVQALFDRTKDSKPWLWDTFSPKK